MLKDVKICLPCERCHGRWLCLVIARDSSGLQESLLSIHCHIRDLTVWTVIGNFHDLVA